MTYSAFAIANTLYRLSVKPLTGKDLQGLVYVAQARGLFNGWRLHDDVSVRWPTGPVIPCIFHKYRAYQDAPIDRSISVVGGIPVVPDGDHRTMAVLQSVLADFAVMDSEDLHAMVTRVGGAWFVTTEGSPIAEVAMKGEDFARTCLA